MIEPLSVFLSRQPGGASVMTEARNVGCGSSIMIMCSGLTHNFILLHARTTGLNILNNVQLEKHPLVAELKLKM